MLVLGVLLGLAMAIFRWVEMEFLIFNPNLEVYTAIVAIVFGGLGFWISNKRSAQKASKPEEFASPVFLPGQNQTLLSNRELEVLHLLAQGKTNQEIADLLFVSANTIKTHTSRLYDKLEVKRRTEAVKRARELGVLV